MKRKYFKYNQDDILEILMETLADNKGINMFNSTGTLIVEKGEVFFVGVIGEEDDLEINKIDLHKLYSEMEYNGTHPEGIGFSSTEALSEALEKAMETGDF